MATSIVVLVVLLMSYAEGIGLCREDNSCTAAPKKPPFGPAKCDCWSSCNSFGDGRKCDNANPAWGNAAHDPVQHSSDGCTWIPFPTNTRDLCHFVAKFDESTYTNTSTRLSTSLY